ncbi:XRE family transcriptional regulator [Streptomyces tauricus]|uniref:XRE family transcriptional regulator n=1 Tax=Streptomyces tauricus TaxID=68274 RepID=A0ABZ1JT34_9ACTN|nr:XRE family transcriptional regulator [Streptomyces tauricus]MCW8102230.1 XRE family transcriptional regulator [Streptomyces tauricus]
MADPYEVELSLAETVRRIAQAMSCDVGELGGLLDVERLSRSSGVVPVDVIALLAGLPVPPVALSERLAQRLNFVRHTHRHANGAEYTIGELAEAAGMSRQGLTKWRDGVVIPGMERVESLRLHFQLPPGFFTATPEEALNAVLQQELKNLRRLEGNEQNDARLQDAGIRRLVTRAVELTPGQQEQLISFAEFLARSGSDDDTST